jgi:four helix bundle protein
LKFQKLIYFCRPFLLINHLYVRVMDNLSFEDLEAWKAARALRMSICTVAKSFPPYEEYKLKDQIIRSSRSVSANIAEGCGRFHKKESMKSCRIARGSLLETLDHLIVARDENYIDEAKLKELRSQYDRCLKLINGFVKYLKNRKE